MVILDGLLRDEFVLSDDSDIFQCLRVFCILRYCQSIAVEPPDSLGYTLTGFGELNAPELEGTPRIVSLISITTSPRSGSGSRPRAVYGFETVARVGGTPLVKIVREELLDILSELEKFSEISDKSSEKFSDDSEIYRGSPTAIRYRTRDF
jgi:hypothetical protein